MSCEDDVLWGARAREVLESEVFVQARQRVRDGIQAQMLAVPLAQTDMHTRLVMMLQLWHALESYLDQTAQTGRMAEFQLEQEKQKRKLFSFG